MSFSYNSSYEEQLTFCEHVKHFLNSYTGLELGERINNLIKKTKSFWFRLRRGPRPPPGTLNVFVPARERPTAAAVVMRRNSASRRHPSRASSACAAAMLEREASLPAFPRPVWPS